MKKVEKPWGHEIIFAQTPQYIGKLLFIKKGHRSSLQYHRKKDEAFYLHSGRLLFYSETNETDGIETEMRDGDAHAIEVGEVHRFTALEDCVIFEVSSPYPDDVVRLQDDYGRA